LTGALSACTRPLWSPVVLPLRCTVWPTVGGPAEEMSWVRPLKRFTDPGLVAAVVAEVLTMP